MRIVVIDGMGGGIGAQLILKIRELMGAQHDIIALGTNSGATERMLKAGASRGATGENAIKVSVSLGDYILGPIGIVIGNSLMGEMTFAAARAVLSAPGKRILLPLQTEHFHIVGVEPLPFAEILTKTVYTLKEMAQEHA
ncbi:MAG: DUF3842 family protein [Spirochaetaceae bacterium]|jgi:hypothetical protein|nr:DUF3842 family protein [Spirochaetaceae bacterium]